MASLYGPMAISPWTSSNLLSDQAQGSNLSVSRKIGPLPLINGGVNDYVASVLEMESKNRLGLCDEARQMAKKASKGLSALFMSETQAQPTKAPGRRALLKEGQPSTPA